MSQPVNAKMLARRESRKSPTAPRSSRNDYPDRADALPQSLEATPPVFSGTAARREARKSTCGPRPSSSISGFDFDAETLVGEPSRGSSGYGAVQPVLAGRLARKVAQQGSGI